MLYTCETEWLLSIAQAEVEVKQSKHSVITNSILTNLLGSWLACAGCINTE